jgi:hypothetical protein
MLGQARRGSLLSTVKPLSEMTTVTAGPNGGGGIVDTAALLVAHAQMYNHPHSLHHDAPPLPQPQHAVRRASMDVKLEYAIAMINQDATLDSDDGFMSPFGTRRDSVCGNNSNKQPLRRRHVKRSAESA